MKNIFLLVFVIVVDQATKWWVLSNFQLYESLEVIPGFFSLTFITNNGAAFGLLGGEHAAWRQMFFVVVALLALGFMLYVYRDLRQKGAIFALAISLIGAGAIGNLLDRLRFGFVIDFLDFYIKNHHWPAFNVADSAILIGVTLFIIGHLYLKDEH